MKQNLSTGNSTYEVELNSKNQLRWLGKKAGQDVRLKKTTVRFLSTAYGRFLRAIPLRGQL